MTARLTLDGLIRAHRESTGDSFAMIALRAGLSVATVRNLATPLPTHTPMQETLEKLATALGQPSVTVRIASMMTAGTFEQQDGAERFGVKAGALKGLSPQNLAAAAVVLQSLTQPRRPCLSAQ